MRARLRRRRLAGGEIIAGLEPRGSRASSSPSSRETDASRGGAPATRSITKYGRSSGPPDSSSHTTGATGRPAAPTARSASYSTVREVQVSVPSAAERRRTSEREPPGHDASTNQVSWLLPAEARSSDVQVA